MKWILTFQRPSQLLSNTGSIVWTFPFKLLDASLLGTPEEARRTSPHQIIVTATEELVLAWQFYFVITFEDSERVRADRHNLMKVLFEYGKRYIFRRLEEEGTLQRKERLDLNTSNVETPCLFDPSRIHEPTDAKYEIDTSPPISSPSGINITVINGDMSIDGDVVGRDKTDVQQK